MFDWNEFSNKEIDNVLFRMVDIEEKNLINEHQYNLHQVLKDVIDIMHGGDSDKLMDLVKLVNKNLINI